MKRPNTRRFFAVLTIAFATMVFSSKAQDSEKNLMKVAEATESISTFRKLLKAAGMGPTITGTKEYTIFAPSNEAFTYLGATRLKEVLETKDPAVLKAIIELHIVPGKLPTSKLKEGKVKTLSGDMVEIYIDEEETSFGNAIFETADLTASNGVIHVIDSVMKIYSDED